MNTHTVCTFLEMQKRRCSSSKWGSCSSGDLDSCRPWTIIWVSFMQFSMLVSRGAWNPEGRRRVSVCMGTKSVNMLDSTDITVCVSVCVRACVCTSSAVGHHRQLAAHIDHLLKESWTLPHHKSLIWCRNTSWYCTFTLNAISASGVSGLH